jgi:enamine deaminase RidA (YjgF/YER057c/UK114 family)
MDAIAAAPAVSEVVRSAARGLAAAGNETHVAVLPAGPALFISGYAEPGEPAKAAGATMIRLGTAMELLGLRKDDAVQVKAFVATATDPEVVRREIRAFFGERSVPPLVLLEWRTKGRAVEIELVAAGRGKTAELPSNPIEYITPPGETANPLFTRMVRINRGKLVYTAGLHGRRERDAEPQIRDIFSELRGILQEAGSSFEHMAKATYYVAGEPTSDQLNRIRRELYPPQRLPAASKINVTGTGRPGKTITLDMIAVAP